MIEQNKRLIEILKSLPFYQGKDLEDLLKSRTYLWNTVKNQLKKNIKYAFDEEFQNQINKILSELDGILRTRETAKIKKKTKETYGDFPEILGKIMNEYQELVQEEENNQDQFQLKERILQSVFEGELKRFTFSQLKEIIEKKLKILKTKKVFRMTEEQKELLKACEEFLEFFEEDQIDLNVVDELIQNRIQERPDDSLNSSTISQITTKPYETLHSFDASENESFNQSASESASESFNQSVNESASESESDKTSIIQMLEKISLSEVRSQISVPQQVSTQRRQPFMKKDNPVLFLTRLEQKPQTLTTKVENEKEEEEEEKSIDFIPINRKPEIPETKPQSLPNNQIPNTNPQNRPQLFSNNIPNNRIQEPRPSFFANILPSNLIQEPRPQPQINNIIPNNRIEEPRPQLSINNIPRHQNQEDLDSTISTNQTFIQEEDQRFNESKSRALIQRYSSQSRFTRGNYSIMRELQVKQIENHQLNPLLQVLRQIRTKDIDRYSHYNQEIQVEVYGSFQNKSGFRKTSDININLTVLGLKESNMHSSLFNLRTLLDNYRKNGVLSQLNLRSVIYSQDHNEIILSHMNNQSKTRDEKVVNYIFLTVNRKEFTFSSKFMKEIIYSGEEKSTDVAHLTNVLHLVFKANNILDHKDMYHSWFTTSYEEKMRKENSQKLYVSISIHSLHMMILFYLQQAGIISKISYLEHQEKHDFELLNGFFTLYENFVDFLRFYSSEGDYKRLYAGITFIDVVERPNHQQMKVQLLVSSLSHNITAQQGGYLFGFVHPMISQLIEANNEQTKASFVTFEILKGSDKERLFFKKIDRMLDIVSNIRPNQNFDPNLLFEYFNAP